MGLKADKSHLENSASESKLSEGEIIKNASGMEDIISNAISDVALQNKEEHST